MANESKTTKFIKNSTLGFFIFKYSNTIDIVELSPLSEIFKIGSKIPILKNSTFQ